MLLLWSWNTSVSTVNRLEAGQPKNRGSIPSKNKMALDPKKSRLTATHPTSYPNELPPG